MPQYSANKLQTVYGGVKALQVETVKVTPSAPMTSSTMLVDGTEVVNVSADNSADIEVTIAQTSVTNSLWSADVTAMKALGTVIFKPFLLKDLNGTTLMSSDSAYLTGYPDVEFAKESGNRVWKIRCSKLQVHVGSNF